MPVDERRSAPLSRYRCDLRYVVGSRASAYGYTLTVWFTGMVLSHAVGLPSPPLAFSFFLGAVLGFAAVGVVAFEGPHASWDNARPSISRCDPRSRVWSWRSHFRHAQERRTQRGPRGGESRIDNTAKLLSDTPHTLWTIFGV